MPATNLDRQGKNAAASREGKHLTFSLADEEYGIAILKVREIIGMMPIRPVPRTPGFLKGVINLRGKVIPVVDLRLKFDLPSRDYDERTCIIVVDATIAGDIAQIGIIVDHVSEVLNIKEAEIEDAPNFGAAAVDTAYIVGMAKTEGGVKILMDIDRVLAGEPLAALSA